MVTNTLPAQTTPFIGRGEELAQIASLLADSSCHLLTLVGPGGIGKTRLAFEVARLQQDNFSDGTYFALLQPLTSPDFIISTIADAIGFRFYPGPEPKQQLFDYLREKSLLLVLDNFEHLSDGAGLLSEIVGAARKLRILATSRERLNLVEEWVFDVREMSHPANEAETDIEAYDAVRLFVQHARRVNNNFSLTSRQKPAIIRICRLVAGMPLGIELAAAWARVLSCEQIASELERSLDILETTARNVELRHRKMRVVFEPTWERLSENERSVFMRLSVFRGGFTREAGEFVAGASLHTLLALVDKSLLRVDNNGRYDIHELLRQYAEERLDETPDEKQARQNMHAVYFSDLLHWLEEKLKGSQLMAALGEIDEELDNIRNSWQWSVSHCNEALIQKSIQSLTLFFIMRSRRQDGDQAFSLLLPCLRTTENMLTAQVLLALASFKISRDHSSFMELAQSGLRIWRNLGSPSGLGFSVGYLTVRLLQICTYDEIAPFCQKALIQAREVGDLWETAWWLHSLGDFILRSGNTTEALPLLQQSVGYFRRLGNRWALTFPLGGLEAAYADLGDYHQSQLLNQEGLATCREIGDREGIIWRCGRLADLAYIQRDSESAKYYLRELIRLALELRLDARIHEFSAGLIINLLLEAGEKAHAVELIAMLQTDLVKQADSTHHRAGVQEFEEHYKHHLSTLESQLPSDVFDAARQRGEALNLRTAMAELVDSFLVSHEQRLQTTELTVNTHTSSRGLGLTESLSERELEILRLIANGLSNRDIASKLIFSVGTVKWYVHQIHSKLGVSSRTQAIARARELKLLP